MGAGGRLPDCETHQTHQPIIAGTLQSEQKKSNSEPSEELRTMVFFLY